MIAVLIIDMQNAFFEDPVLSNCRESPTVACNEITAAAQERATKVQLVKSEHEEDKSTWTLNMLEDDQGSFSGTRPRPNLSPGSRSKVCLRC